MSEITGANLPIAVGSPTHVWVQDEAGSAPVRMTVAAFATNIASHEGPTYSTRAELFADLAWAEGTRGYVVGDSTTAYNGTYLKAGASGAGSWSKIGPVPSYLANLSLAPITTNGGTRAWPLGERFRLSPLDFIGGDVAATEADAFNAAAVVLAARGGGVLDLSGHIWSFDSPLTVDGNYITIDATAAAITFTDTVSGPCITFGNGATLRQSLRVLGGVWVQGNSCNQPLFKVRRVRNFYTTGCNGSGLYSVITWGDAADAASSYQWWETDCEWNLRTFANGGHTHGYYIINASGGWYRSNCFIEGHARDVSASGTTLASRGVYFPPAFTPARFDDCLFLGGIIKGFARGIAVEDARLVNFRTDRAFRIDDSVEWSISVEISSGAAAGEGIGHFLMYGQCLGQNDGGGILISSAKSDADITQVVLDINAALMTTAGVKIITTAGNIKSTTVRVNGFGWAPASVNERYVVFDTSGGGTIEATLERLYVENATVTMPNYVVYNNTDADDRIRISDDYALFGASFVPGVSVVYDPVIGSQDRRRFCAIRSDGTSRPKHPILLGPYQAANIAANVTNGDAVILTGSGSHPSLSAPDRGLVLAPNIAGNATTTAGSITAKIRIGASVSTTAKTALSSGTTKNGARGVATIAAVAAAENEVRVVYDTTSDFAPAGTTEFNFLVPFLEA